MEVLQGLFFLLVALLTSPEGSVFCVPQINITSETLVIKLSSPLTLNCSSSSLSGKVKWRLMRDSDFRIKTITNGHYSTMEIQSITEEDTSYTCEEKFANKNSRATVKLYYFSGPTITTEPKDPQTGQPFQLKCEVKIHQDLTADMKLKHGERVLLTQNKCADNFYSTLCPCEASAEVNTSESETQYKCEATLQKDSSQHTESATLMLKLREAASTIHLPTETTPLRTENTPLPKETTPIPTEAVVNKRVTVQTDQPNPQSSTEAASTIHLPTGTIPLSKETTPLAKETTPLPTAAVVNKTVTVQTDQLNSQSSTDKEKSSSTILVVVVLCVVILVLVCIVLFIRSKKRKEAQPQ